MFNLFSDSVNTNSEVLERDSSSLIKSLKVPSRIFQVGLPDLSTAF